MAANVEVLRIILRARNEASKAFKQAGMDIGRTMQNIKRWASVGAIAIAALGDVIMAKAINAFMEFDLQIRRVGIIADAIIGGKITPEFEKLRQVAIELGTTTPFKPIEVASQAMERLAQAGLNANDVLEATPGIIAAAVTANEDLGNTTDLLVNTMFQFGLQAKDMTHIADVMTIAAIDSVASMQSLAFSLKFIGPFAKALGMNLERTTAMIGLFSNMGLQGSMAGTGMRRMLAQLVDAMDDTTKSTGKLSKGVAVLFKEKFGVKILDEATGNMRNLVAIFHDLAVAGAKPTQVMVKFGQRAGIAATSLFQDIKRGIDAIASPESIARAKVLFNKFLEEGMDREEAKKIADAWSRTIGGTIEASILTGAGKAQESMDTLMKGFTLLVKRMQSNVNVVLINIGSVFAEVFGPIIEEKVIPALINLQDEILKSGRLRKVFEGFAGSFGLFVEAIARGKTDVVESLITIISVTRTVKEVLLFLIGVGSDVVAWLRDHGDALKWILEHWKLILGLLLGAKGLSMVISLFASLRVAGIISSTKALKLMKVAAVALFSPTGLLLVGVAAATFAFFKLKNASQDAADVLEGKIFEATTKEFRNLDATIRDMVEGVEEGAPEAIKELEQNMSMGLKELNRQFGNSLAISTNLFTNISRAGPQTQGAFVGMIRALQQVDRKTEDSSSVWSRFIAKMGEDLRTGVAPNWQLVAKNIKEARDEIKFIEGLADAADKASTKRLSNLKEGILAVAEATEKAFKKLGIGFETEEEKFTGAAQAIRDEMIPLLEEIERSQVSPEQKDIDRAEIFAGSVGKISIALGDAHSSAEDLLEKFKDGKAPLKDLEGEMETLAGLQRLTNTLQREGVDIPQDLLESFKEAKAAFAETDVFAQLGANMQQVLDDFDQGINVSGDRIQKVVDLFNRYPDVFKSTTDFLLSTIENQFGVLKGEITSLTQALEGLKTGFQGFMGVAGPVGVAEGGELLTRAGGGLLGGAFKAIKQFQAGGIARQPTLGLIGEGGLSEAVVPLPNGRSIPVDFREGGQAVEFNIINVVDASFIDGRIAASENTIMNMMGRSAKENKKIRRIINRG